MDIKEFRLEILYENRHSGTVYKSLPNKIIIKNITYLDTK